MSNPLEEVKKFTVGQLAALVHNLGGPEVVEEILKGQKKVCLEQLASVAGAGRMIEIGNYVEKLIKAGYHKAVGMSASSYRRLWPKSVTQPPEYAGRFDEVLLVDRAIAVPKLVKCGNFYIYTEPSACTDMVKAPVDPKTNQPLTRYICFVQLGEKNLNRSVEDCSKDEVGLVTAEGLHLPVQQAAYLRKYAVDLAGSRCESVNAPYVSWFGSAQPGFCASGVRNSNPYCGSASRGGAVITVP